MLTHFGDCSYPLPDEPFQLGHCGGNGGASQTSSLDPGEVVRQLLHIVGLPLLLPQHALLEAACARNQCHSCVEGFDSHLTRRVREV